MTDERIISDSELATCKRVYQRSGDRVSMHCQFALDLIATVEQVRSELLARDARNRATQHGWTNPGPSVDLCPECSQEQAV